jgi:Protein of unknown function (DUF3592)
MHLHDILYIKPLLLVFIGIAGILYSIFKKTKNRALKDAGTETEGIIFTQNREQKAFTGINPYKPDIMNKVTVRFVTQKKEWITAEIKQDFATYFTGQYKQGDKVVLYYDPFDPKIFYVDTKQSELIGRILIAVVGIGLLLAGLHFLYAQPQS